MKNKQPIKASVLSDITNFIKAMSDVFFKFIDKLDSWGVVTTDSQTTEDGGAWMNFSYKGKHIEMTTTPVPDKKGYFNIVIKLASGSKKQLDNVSEKDIESKVTAVLKECFGADFGQKDSENKDVSSSKVLKVRLQKISSSKDINIELSSITANYNPIDAVADLDLILDNDAFVSEISDTPTCFEISDDGDEFNISSIDEFSDIDKFNQLISTAMLTWSNLSVIHWAAKGTHFADLHEYLNDCRNRLIYEVDMIGELSMEFSDTVINPGAFMHDDISGINDNGEGFTAEYGFQLVSDVIEQYISVLDTYYVNFPHDVQSWFDEEIRYWKKQKDYFLKQRAK